MKINIEMKKFTKNDTGFKCLYCDYLVPPLKSSSRDHCSQCLRSIHVDVNPGDRSNTCHGILEPVSVTQTAKKGYTIHYVCKKCGAKINNKAAEDDNFEEILRICKQL